MSKLKESFILNVAFPLADKVMGTCAMKWLRQIQLMNTWSKEQIEKWQLEQLHRLLEHAYNHTKYYREIFDDLNLKPSDIQTFEDLKKLPVLTRNIIKERYNDLIPDNINSIKHRSGSTGGSTGEPMKFICDENTWGFVTAMKIYSWKTTGYKYGDCFVSLGSSSLFPVNKKNIVSEIYFKLRNTIPLNGMNMDEETCAKYMNIIKSKNIKYVYGYASAIYLLAKFCIENNIQYTMKCCFATAEKLAPHYRETIEKAWDTKVMDCYGSRDGGVTAYEIKSGEYHVGYASFLETELRGEPSTLYSTNLIDYAFPMIRYANGDEVEKVNLHNASIYNGQMLKCLIGRTSDVIQLSNGHKLTTPGFTIMFRGFNIESYRIKKTGSMQITVTIKKKESFTEEDHELIVATMHKYVGHDCEVIIKYVDKMEPLKNGKRSFFMN